MSFFASIVEKIFGYAGAAPAGANPGVGALQQTATAQAATQLVDAKAVLSGMAAQAGGGGDWDNSIVDLLKLLHLDSSLDARRKLAGELDVHAGADGSAEQNVALHRAVMRKLAENGGRMPVLA